MVSHAARVGAITMMRPVGGSAPTKASWSGRYGSRTFRITPRNLARRRPLPYAGGLVGKTIGVAGFTPVNPLAFGGGEDLVVRFRVVSSDAKSSPKMTVPFCGRFFTAVGQSVAA